MSLGLSLSAAASRPWLLVSFRVIRGSQGKGEGRARGQGRMGLEEMSMESSGGLFAHIGLCP